MVAVIRDNDPHVMVTRVLVVRERSKEKQG
jgi:hypothetical protein